MYAMCEYFTQSATITRGAWTLGTPHGKDVQVNCATRSLAPRERPTLSPRVFATAIYPKVKHGSLTHQPYQITSHSDFISLFKTIAKSHNIAYELMLLSRTIHSSVKLHSGILAVLNQACSMIQHH